MQKKSTLVHDLTPEQMAIIVSEVVLPHITELKKNFEPKT